MFVLNGLNFLSAAERPTKAPRAYYNDFDYIVYEKDKSVMANVEQTEMAVFGNAELVNPQGVSVLGTSSLGASLFTERSWRDLTLGQFLLLGPFRPLALMYAFWRAMWRRFARCVPIRRILPRHAAWAVIICSHIFVRMAMISQMAPYYMAMYMS